MGTEKREELPYWDASSDRVGRARKPVGSSLIALQPQQIELWDPLPKRSAVLTRIQKTRAFEGCFG